MDSTGLFCSISPFCLNSFHRLSMLRSLVQKRCSFGKSVVSRFSTLSDVKVSCYYKEQIQIVTNKEIGTSSTESRLFPLLGSTTVFNAKGQVIFV